VVGRNREGGKGKTQGAGVRVHPRGCGMKGKTPESGGREKFKGLQGGKTGGSLLLREGGENSRSHREGRGWID